MMINVRRLKYRAKYYGGLKRHFVLFWASILQTLFQTDWKSFLWKISTSVLAFHIFVVILPVCFISWIVLECYRRLMRRWISYKEKGDIEVADVTFRTAMSTNDNDPILTILFSLEGHVENHVIEIWLKDLLAKRNDSGDLVHKHFKCNLVKVNGFYCWKIDQNFDLQNHIIRAPSHHHGTILTERNIQEYISEVCSEMLSKNQSPWQVKLIEGFAENGTRVTWIVFRLHHLLSSQINLPDFSLSLPNPWDTVNTTRVYNILEAPNATKKLLTHVKYYIFNSVGYFFKKLKVLLVLIREYLKNFHLNTLKGCNRKWILEPKYFSRFSLSDFKLIVQALKPEKSLINLILKNASTFTDICLRSIVYVYMRSKYILLTLINFNFEERCKIFRNNSTFCMVQNAIIELFWMLRALLSLPRLILEEIYESKDTSPINTCKRKNFQKWKRLIVSWSEDTPMDGAKGIQGVSGTSVSCVLLTALAGGIRDLLRYSGAQAPEYVRCTLPVCIPHMFPLKGLLPLSLPTGCSYGRKALREVSKSLEKMKNYPESYLASSWLIKNLCKFLPERLLCFILKHLSKSYPVLLINIVGSSQTSYIWGLKLKSAFYWRPPQNDASISVCISSYCGNISVGVMADGWSVPHVSYLPKSFLSHLNELAVESGVGIKRKNSKPLCKTYSPVESPSPVGSSSTSSMKSWNKVLFHFKNNAVFRQKFVSIEKLTSQEKSNSN